MIQNQLIEWLLEGDVSIQFQTNCDLLGNNRPDLQKRISIEGWGAKYLSLRNSNGYWGMGFYQPKWTSTHYTLLDLKNLFISKQNPAIKETISILLKNHKSADGGINPAKTVHKSDVCVNGMFLNYASYFMAPQEELKSIVDFILSQQMDDGGFNCHSNMAGAKHSSLHTTLSVLEGILEYTSGEYAYRKHELMKAACESREFILEHKLYQSHRTGKTIDRKMLMLSFPSRWRYDILRALDYFYRSGSSPDVRMTDALNLLIGKRRADKTWPLQAKHPGKVHFDMEKAGLPSRWNTLRALRVLKYFGYQI